MLYLIAESKTMIGSEEKVSPDQFQLHAPCFEAEADAIMQRIKSMTPEEIASEIKVSPAMANKIFRMAYDFPFKENGSTAIESFTGVVFKNLDYPSLTKEERERGNRDIRIISSLYGWLKPEDIVKPYRLEFTSPLGPDGSPLYSYWRKLVTIRLVKYLKETGTTAIINLLPGDAAKCIDWKLVKRFAKVWKVDFKEAEGDSFKTPAAGKLKAMRGSLLREVLKTNPKTPKDMQGLETDSFIPLAESDYPDRITYQC